MRALPAFLVATMRSLAAVIMILGLLPALARAKGIQSAVVCGASSCRTIEDSPTLSALFAGGRQVSEPRPAPFYRVEMRFFRGPGRVGTGPMLTYVPAARALRRRSVRGRGLWARLDPEQLRVYRGATASLRPLPAHLIDQPNRLPKASWPAGPPQSRMIRASVAEPLTLAGLGIIAGAVAFALRRRRRAHRPVLFSDA